MNEPITTLDTRHGVPRGGVTPWEEVLWDVLQSVEHALTQQGSVPL